MFYIKQEVKAERATSLKYVALPLFVQCCACCGDMLFVMPNTLTAV